MARLPFSVDPLTEQLNAEVAALGRQGIAVRGEDAAKPAQDGAATTKAAIDKIATETRVPANILMALAEKDGAQDGPSAIAAAQKHAAALAGKPLDSLDDALLDRADAIGKALYADATNTVSVTKKGERSKTSDMGKSITAAAIDLAGAVPSAVGTIVDDAAGLAKAALTPATIAPYSTEIIRDDDGIPRVKPRLTDGGKPGTALGRGLRSITAGIGDGADAVRDSRSEEAKAQEAASINPDANILKGENPISENWTVEGLAHHMASALGSMAPVVATAIATRGRSLVAPAAVGGLGAGGAARSEVEDKVDRMAQDMLPDGRSRLEAESQTYQDAIKGGATPEEALARTKHEAGRAATYLAGLPAAVGSAVTGKIATRGIGALAGRGMATRAAGTAAISAAEESAQEVAEGVGQQAGLNYGAGVNESLAEGSAVNALLGAMGGGPVGAVSGAVHRGEPPQVPPPSPTAEMPIPPETIAPAPAGPAGAAGYSTDAPLGGPPPAPAAPPAAPIVPNYPIAPEAAALDAVPPPAPVAQPKGRLESALEAAAPVAAPEPLFVGEMNQPIRIVDTPTGEAFDGVFIEETPDGVMVNLGGADMLIPRSDFEQGLAVFEPVPSALQPAAAPAPEQSAEAEHDGTLRAHADDDGRGAEPAPPQGDLGQGVRGDPALAEPAAGTGPERDAALPGPAPVAASGDGEDLAGDADAGNLDDPVAAAAGAEPAPSVSAAPVVDQKAPAGETQPALPIADEPQRVAASNPDQMAAPQKTLGETPAAPAAAVIGSNKPDPVRAAVRAAAQAGEAEHTTKKGKVLTGYVAQGLTPGQAKGIDPYAFKKDGGWFIRKDDAQKAYPDLAAPAAAADTQLNAPRSVVQSPADAQQEPGERVSEMPKTEQAAADVSATAAVAEPGAVAIAAADADPAPTDAQKDAENYRTGKASWNGLRLSIENAKGAERSGTGQNGKPWSVTMPAHYGRILRTTGADGDHVDFYMGDDEASEFVLVVDQKDADTGKWDEHKVVLGTSSAAEAIQLYKAGFSDGRGAERIGGVREFTRDEFKDWLANGDTRKPASPQFDGALTTPRDGQEEPQQNKGNAALTTQKDGQQSTASSADFAPAPVAEARAQPKPKIAPKAQPADAGPQKSGPGYLKAVNNVKGKTKGKIRDQATADYFTPGNIVPSYGDGHDRVLSFDPASSAVRVQAVTRQGDGWTDARAEWPRVHRTMPDDRALATGPVYRATAGDTPPEAAVNQGPIKKPAVQRRLVKTDKAITARGRELPVEYSLVELDDLIPSQMDDGRDNPAFPQDLQPRDRSGNKSQEQVRKIASDLRPALLGENPQAGAGAPIITRDGVVISGNGRTLALRRAHAEGNADRYRAWLDKQGYPVDGLRQPVLVRVLTEDMDTAALAATAREANERDTATMSASEQAIADAKTLRPAVLDLYRGGDVDAAGNRDFVRGFLGQVVAPAEMGNLIRDDGSMTQDAVRRVQAAMLARAYGDADLIGAVMESTESSIKAIGGALMDVAPRWAQMRDAAEASTIAPQMDQTKALREAVRLVDRARRAGRKVDEFVGQGDMFSGDTVSPMGKAFLGLMFRDAPASYGRPRGRDKLTDALTRYADEAMKTQPGADMLGETANPERTVATIKEQADGDAGRGQGGLFDAGNGGDGAGDGSGSGRRERSAGPGEPAAERSADQAGAGEGQAEGLTEAEPGAAEPGGEAERLTDLGEKIGGARKDTAERGVTREKRAPNTDQRPAWMRRYEVGEVVSSTHPGEQGRFRISDNRTDRPASRDTFPTREEAEAAIPLIEVSRNHRAMGERDGTYSIVRTISDRKRVTIKDGFKDRDEAMRYMAQNAAEIIETQTRIDDRIHPALEEAIREGAARRDEGADVSGQDFMDVFGFRGVEFGNWNNTAERQHLLNQAYDAFLDLAEIMSVPPRALSLNGELALAFGARGQGLSGARAHYERDRGVINLTKIQGAGALAHEWMHAFDHYLARQDGKAKAGLEAQEDGTRKFVATDREGDYVSHGFPYRRVAGGGAGTRPEVRDAFKAVMDAIKNRKAEFTEDRSSREKLAERAQARVAGALDEIRANLAATQSWGKKTAPATPEQLAAFDAAASRILDRQPGEQEARGGYMFHAEAWKVSEVMKAVRGRQGFSRTQGRLTGAIAGLNMSISDRALQDQFLADAAEQRVKEKKVLTEYASEAWKMDRGTKGDYWSTPHEMLARAFESFVYDRLKGVEARNDFLAYEKHNDLPDYRLLNVKPFPEGAERQSINDALQALFDTLETREGEGGKVELFQRDMGDGEAAPVARVARFSVIVGDTLPERRKAALQWFRDNLLDRTVTNAETGMEITFNVKGAKESVQATGDDTLAMIPALTDILRDGSYLGSEPDRRGRPQIKAVHRFRAVVELDGERLGVIAIVRETTDGRYHYRLAKEDVGAGPRPAVNLNSTKEQVFAPALEGSADTINLAIERPSVKPITPAQARAINDAGRREMDKVGLLGKIGLTVEAGRLVGATGTYSRGVISILRNSAKGWRHTLDHEIVHALRDPARWGGTHGLFTAEEWRALVRAGRADKAVHDRVMRHYGDKTTGEQSEEMVAELYADWAKAGREPPAGPLGAALRKIGDFFRAMASAFRAVAAEPRQAVEVIADLRGVAQIMERIASGEVGGRGTDGGGTPRGPDGRFTVAEQRSDAEPFGPILHGYEGRWREVALELERLGTGEAPGALHHQEVGPIALVWGKEGTGKSDGFGLSKLIAWHPEVLDDLQRRLDGMKVTSRSSNRVQLHGESDQASISLKYHDADKVWMLTAYDRGVPRRTERSIARLHDLWGDRTPSPRRGNINVDPSDPSVKERRDMDGDEGQERALVARILDGATEWAAKNGREMGGDAASMARDVTRFARAIPGEVRKRGSKEGLSFGLTDAMAGGPGGQSSILGLVPGRALFMELGKALPSARVYLREKGAMDALRNAWHARADKTAQAWRKLLADKDTNADLMDLMHEATLTQVDPSVEFEREATKRHRDLVDDPRASDRQREWAASVIARDGRRHASWTAMRQTFRKLPPEYQAMFAKVRDEYGAMADAQEQAIIENIEKSMKAAVRKAQDAHDKRLREIKDEGLTGDEKAAAIAEARDALTRTRARAAFQTRAKAAGMRQKFEANRLAGPYFPLARFGDLFVTARDKASGRVESFSLFQTAREQAAWAKQAAAAGYDVQTGTMSNANDVRGAVDPGFVAEIQSMLGDAGVDDLVMDQVWQHFLNTLPDMSIRKNRIHRKGRAWFSRDAFRAFGKQMFHGAHQLARLKHGVPMSEALAEMEKEAAVAKDPVRAGLVVNEMNRRHDFTLNPTGHAWTQYASTGAFVWHLAMSPAAAMVNVSQTTVIGIPIMGAAFRAQGVKGAAAELSRSLGDFTRGRGHAADSRRLTDQERAALNEGYARSVIDKSQAHDLAGVGETGVEYSDVRARWMAKLSWAFHHTERMNREVTFLAAYRMARKDGSDHDSAINTASDLTWKVHFDYQASSRPRIMQGDFQKVLLTFRNYSINVLWRLFRDGHQAMLAESPEDRAIARRQLLGITASMALHAGIRGTWGYGLLMTLAGLFFAGGGDEAEEELKKLLVGDADDAGVAAAIRRNVGGMILNGAPGHLTGTNLSERIGMGNLWLRDNGRMEEGRDAYLSLLDQLAGPAIGTALSTPFNVAKDMGDGHYWRAAETAVPKFVRDGLKASRYLSEGVVTRRGDDIVPDVSIMQAIAQASGFTPAQVAERYAANSRMMNKQERIIGRRSGIQKEAGDAMIAGKPIPAGVLTKLRAFNAEYPEYPITQDTVKQSVSSRMRASQRNEFGIALNPKLNARIRGEQAGMVYE